MLVLVDEKGEGTGGLGLHGLIRVTVLSEQQEIAALTNSLIEDIILNVGDFMVRSMKLKERWMGLHKLGLD